jgi:nucleotide-binding universal stress UspA family protein
MSRVSDFSSRNRRIRSEQAAGVGLAPTMPPLPPEAAGLADEAAAFLVGEQPDEVGDDPRNRKAFRLLLPYTGSEPAERALQVTVDLASRFTAEVRVLHLREWDDLGRGGRWFLETREEAVAVTRDAVERLQGHGLGATGVVQDSPRNKVACEIVNKADELHIDAIVLGARRRPLIVAALSGSISLGLLRRANCPVILVRTPRR